MKPISVARRLPKHVWSDPLPAAFVRRLLNDNPEIDEAIVTLRVADNAVMGVSLGQESMGWPAKCSFTSRPVSWCEINGAPLWGPAGKLSYGPYVSRECDRDELISFLK